ncbi:nucleotidyltransferase substrate binding protein [Butyricicoccus faecihominis]|uniref:nucleotidyltransferase substrate binding protein n=1 Tax=Butyricicoccus faecihominis TaxID=1712515 RepID=UPI00247A0939|nr:nucleotidyltransferase substrate binding protein [Butyricicoccus faecihominis]MCQ5129103.1 nucleotidyltransferase substrate binding protein [Butyricicoccus faecihominis]
MKPNKSKRDNYLDAVQRLAEAVTDYKNIPNDTVRDGMIQRFEFTFELAWKALKEYMIDAGVQNTLQFPKQVLREAYATSLISSDSIWLDMLNARNTTSHIYDDHTAAVIAGKIQKSYLPELQKLAALLNK